MKLFECQHCGQPLYFENIRCESCGRSLGYLPAAETISALEEGKRGLRALAERKGRYRYCANAQFGTCNWLVSVDSPEQFCAACRHNRMIPDLSLPENQANWRKIEARQAPAVLHAAQASAAVADQAGGSRARAGVRFSGRSAAEQRAANSAPAEPVMTGHDNGLITINLAEADDSERERMRRQMGEPYRTLLGHFRHEIAHYYWDRLVRDAPGIEAFRQLFGDEREDYGAALQRHYANGPPPDWQERFVTSLRQHPPVGGLGRDLGALFPHGRHAGDGVRLRHAGSSARDQGRRPFDRDRLRSPQRGPGPHRRLLAAADLRGQFDQPQHGDRRPLSVRAGAAGDRQAVLHPRSDSSARPGRGGSIRAAGRSGP